MHVCTEQIHLAVQQKPHSIVKQVYSIKRKRQEVLGDTISLSSVKRAFPTQKAHCISLTQVSLSEARDIHITKGERMGMRHAEGTTAVSHHLMCPLDSLFQ